MALRVCGVRLQDARPQGGKRAIEAGLHGGEVGARDLGDLFERELLVEAQYQDFAAERIKSEQRLGDALAVFAHEAGVEGSGVAGGRLEGALIVTGIAHLFQACHGALAAHVDDQVAGDGEEPGIETGGAVVLATTLEHPHPGLLKKILGELAVAGEIEQIAEETVLIGEDEGIEELDVTLLEAARDGEVFLLLRGSSERKCDSLSQDGSLGFFDEQKLRQDAIFYCFGQKRSR